MNQFLIKSFTIVLSIIFLASCGGDKKEEEFKFYTLKEAGAQQLELTVEASGTVRQSRQLKLNLKPLVRYYF